MFSTRPRYREIRDGDDDDDALDDLEFNDPPKRRSKSLSVILTVALIIAFGLAASFYSAARLSFSSDVLADSPETVHKALQKADIIPNVIDDFTPTFSLSITWPDTDYHAALGNTLRPKNLQSAPQVYITDPPDQKSTTATATTTPANIVLAMTDPDAPSRIDPKWAEFCHWIAHGVAYINASAPTLPQSAANEPVAIVEYRPPGPPAKTGKHRYVFLAFAPANGTAEPLDLAKPDERKGWGVKEWAADMGLEPIAANFIYAKNGEQ